MSLQAKYTPSQKYFVSGATLNDIARELAELRRRVDQLSAAHHGPLYPLAENISGQDRAFGDVVRIAAPSMELPVDTQWAQRPIFRAALPLANDPWREDEAYGVYLAPCPAGRVAPITIAGTCMARLDTTFAEGVYAEVQPANPVLRRQPHGRFRILREWGTLDGARWALISLDVGNYEEVVSIAGPPTGDTYPGVVQRWRDDTQSWVSVRVCQVREL